MLFVDKLYLKVYNLFGSVIMKKCAFVYNPESGKTNSKKDIDKII